MRGYSETDVFSAWELDVLRRATAIVAAVDRASRCHELAHAVARALGLQAQDGHYGMVEHSWVWLTPWDKPWRPGKYPPNVLDVYAVGSLPQVQLVDMRGLLPHMQAYRPGLPRTDVDPLEVDRLSRIAVRLEAA